MRNACYIILTFASLLFLAWGVKVKPAEAAEVSGYRQFFMDQGFMGRDFSLAVDEFNLNISFASSSIPQPGVLHVTAQAVAATTSELGYARFGSDVRLDWTTNAPDSPQTATVKLTDPECGKKAWQVCAIEENYQGKAKLIRPSKPSTGQAEAKIHIGATVRLVEVEGYMSEGYASWYAFKHCPCAASPDFPKGTLVRVTKLSDPVKSIVVKINDWGPERDLFPERAIDLDKVAFAELASTGAGVMRVHVEPLAPDDPDALAYQYKVVTPTKAKVAKKTAPASPDTSSSWDL